MRFIEHRVVTCAFVLGLAFIGSCSEGSPPPATGDAESVGFELQLAPGVAVNSVGWSITNAGSGFSRAGTANVQASNAIHFQIGGVPTGTGFVISLSGTSVDGSLTCVGTATFAVSAGMTTAVSVTFACSPAAPDAGTVVVSGTTVVCANVTSLSAVPLQTAPGGTIALAATASAGALTPTYAWTAPAGTFDDATSASPTFTCPATPGPVTLTVTVSPTAPACTSTTTQSVTVACEALAATFTNVYGNVIGARCTGCHRPGGGGFTVGGLDMSTPAAAYANLVGVPAAGTGAGTSGVTCGSLAPGLLRVRPGDSASSLIFEKVATKLAALPAPCGSPMPTPATAPPLTQAQVDLIKAWIDAGALND